MDKINHLDVCLIITDELTENICIYDSHIFLSKQS